MADALIEQILKLADDYADASTMMEVESHGTTRDKEVMREARENLVTALRAALSAPLSQPVAWMRADGEEGSISTMTACISAKVKDLWLKANPTQVERYTIPLYADPISPDGLQSHPTERAGKVPQASLQRRSGYQPFDTFDGFTGLPTYTVPPAEEDMNTLHGTWFSDSERDLIAERRRQVEAEGWSAEHDDYHTDGGMATAAACYALQATAIGGDCNESWVRHYEDAAKRLWPWDSEWWKPADPRRMLVKAGALILAEIERIDRAQPTAEASGSGGETKR